MKLSREQVKDLAWVAWSYTEQYRRLDLVGNIIKGIAVLVALGGFIPSFILFISHETLFAIGNTTFITGFPITSISEGSTYQAATAIYASNFPWLPGVLTVAFITISILLAMIGCSWKSSDSQLRKYEETLLDIWATNSHKLPGEVVEFIMAEGKLPPESPK